MAILHRNPMPLSGALFVTNPRRRKSVRKNRSTRRKNALKMKRNAKHSALYKFLKSKSNPKKRRNGTKKGMVRKTARRAYMRKNGATKAIRTASGTRYMVDGKFASKAKYDAATKKKKSTAKKSTAKKSTAKKSSAKRKVVTTARGKRYMVGGKFVTKAKYDAAGKKSSVKRKASASKKKGGKKVSKWNKFRTKMKGAGLNEFQMRRLYKRYVNGQETMSSLTKIKKSVDSRSRKLARVGRRTKSRAVTQLKAEKGWLWNPLKKLKVRKNQGIMGVQPLALPLQVVEGVQSKASRLPVVKFVSFAITPIALGAAVYAVHRIAEPHVMKLAEDLKVQKIPVLKETLKFPYTTTGVVAGLALGLLAKAGVLNRNAASMVAASAASVGIALDLSLRPVAKAAESVVEDQVALADMAQGQDMGALHTNPSCYGDGGQYMIGRNSTALGAVHMGAVHMGGVHDSEYGDASPADAKMCTCVMMPDEVAAAKAGKDAYIRKFGLAPRNKYRSQSLYSRHAGRAGHRFGWLINMVGFANFQKIAAMPPKQRATVISQLQKQAIASIPQLVAAQQAQHGDIESASIPVDGTINGVQGFGSAHYGALMFAGSGY